MAALTINNFDGKILIIGPIYDKIDKLEKAISLIPNYDLTIFNGNLCYPNNNTSEVVSRIDKIDSFLKTKKVLYNIGNYDLMLLRQTDNDYIANWLNSKPNVIIIEFIRGTYLIITSGGITKNMNSIMKLYDNIETSFVSKIDNEPWHSSYRGKLGYVVSNNPLTDEYPKFYDFSAQIGNQYSTNNNVYAQEVDQNGLQNTIFL